MARRVAKGDPLFGDSAPAGAKLPPGAAVVELYTDGACRGNPGPGGWGFILKHPASGKVKEGSGAEGPTTNNRMEMTAVIRGLSSLTRPSIVELYSDSDYVISGMRSWMHSWKKFGWKKRASSKEQVKNHDLWASLYDLYQIHEVRLHWVRGHDGHVENERCDVLATTAADGLIGR